MVRLVSILQGLLPLGIGCLIGCVTLTMCQVVFAGRSTPSIALTQPNDGATVAGTISLRAEASDVGFASVSFQANGASLGPDITSGSCTRDWDTSQMADGTYSVTAVGRTDDGMSAASAPALVTVENEAPRIFDIKVWNITDSNASITWYTLLPADTQLNFGPTQAYGGETALVTDLSTIHTVALANLSASTTYHFQVSSENALGRRSTSTDQVFTTAPGSQSGGGGGGAKAPSPPPLTSGVTVTAGRTGVMARAVVAPLTISKLMASVTSTEATITWTTDQPADTEFRYGPGRFREGMAVRGAQLVTNHTVKIGNLTPGVTYLYQAQSRNSQGRTTTSTTLKFSTPR